MNINLVKYMTPVSQLMQRNNFARVNQLVMAKFL